MFFKKKKNQSPLEFLIEQKLNQLKQDNERIFYYHIFDNELDITKKWCKKNDVIMELSHITDNVKVYKFIIS